MASGTLPPVHGPLLDTLALHTLRTAQQYPQPTPSTTTTATQPNGTAPQLPAPHTAAAGARGILVALQAALAHADAVIELDTQLRGALGAAARAPEDGKAVGTAGYHDTLPEAEGVLESGTRVTIRWIPTHARGVACSRCVVRSARVHDTRSVHGAAHTHAQGATVTRAY